MRAPFASLVCVIVSACPEAPPLASSADAEPFDLVDLVDDDGPLDPRRRPDGVDPDLDRPALGFVGGGPRVSPAEPGGPGRPGEPGGPGAGVPELRMSELDCHGTDHVEIVGPPGTDLSDVAVRVDSRPPVLLEDIVIPEGGLVVVEEPPLEGPQALELRCFDSVVQLVRGDEILDEARFPAFPGSFGGTSLCRFPESFPTFAVCAPTLGRANAPFVDPEPLVFNPLVPATIDLEIAPDDLAALEERPREYVPARFTFTSENLVFRSLVVGVALKGSPTGSFRPLDRKSAFKIKFNRFVRGQRFLGLEGVKLDNMVEDPSSTHEVVGYAMLRAAGVPAARAGYAVVRVNGESYGLHATVERIDGAWASRHFRSTRHIYEGGTMGLDAEPGREEEFEVDEGDLDDLSDLRALTAVSQHAGTPFFHALQQRTRLRESARAWMASQYLAHWDGYAGGTNNYYLHSDDDGIFTFIPSGIDQIFEMRPYDLKTGTSPFSTQGLLFARCQTLGACDDTLDQALDDVAPALAGFDALGLLEDVIIAIAPALQEDPRLEASLDEVREAQAATRAFLMARPAVLP